MNPATQIRMLAVPAPQAREVDRHLAAAHAAHAEVLRAQAAFAAAEETARAVATAVLAGHGFDPADPVLLESVQGNSLVLRVPAALLIAPETKGPEAKAPSRSRKRERKP